MKAFIAALFIIILSANAAALGIGPAQVYRVYSPGAEESIQFTVFGEPGTIARIEARGEYLICPEDLALESNISHFECTLSHPSVLSPGAHDIDVVVTESREPQEGMISAIPAAISVVRLDVPRPGIYVQARFDVITSGNDAEFKVTVHNFGTQAAECSATITVESQSVKTQTAIIPSMDERILSASMTLSRGPHEAEAVVRCGSQELALAKAFDVGERFIDISEVSVDTFAPGEIARIRLKLENTWPAQIDDVRAEVVVIVDGHATTLQTETFSITDTHEVSAFWDTQGILSGQYSARATLIYGGALSTREFGIIVPEVKTSIILPLVLVLVAAALIYLWYWFRRKR